MSQLGSQTSSGRSVRVAVAPVELGRGERLWTSPEDLLDRFHLESVPSSSGVAHHLFWRR